MLFLLKGDELSIAVKNPFEKDCKNYFCIENFSKLFIFMLPVGAASIRGWPNYLYAFLFLTSIVWLFKTANQDSFKVTKQEKVFLWSLVLFFASFIFSELMNGWDGVRSHWVTIELRYVCFIPIYFMLRQVNKIDAWLVYGCVLTCYVLAIQAFITVFLNDAVQVDGAYHHIFFGAVAGICLLVVAYSGVELHASMSWKIVSILSILLGMFALALSVARGVYLAVFPLLLIYPFLQKKIKLTYAFVGLCALIVFAYGMYSNVSSIKNRLDTGFNEFSDYLTSDNHAEKYFSELGSVGIRFEYWRASLMIARDNIVYGVGRTGFKKEASLLISDGKISQGVAGVTDPHNAILNIIVSKGMIGGVLSFAIFIMSVYFFLRCKNNNHRVYRLGLIFLAFTLITSLTDSAVFHRGFNLSFTLVFLVVLVASSNKRLDTRQLN